jgi:uncharacterized protein
MPSKRIDVAERRLDIEGLRELAAAGAVIEPQLDVRRFPRLAKLFSPSAETVDAGIDEGSEDVWSGIEAGVGIERGTEGIARLRINVTGQLPLRCQRCLQTMVLPLQLSTRLTVVSDDREAEKLTEPFDSVILEDGELRLETVVEDEILAALPMAPAHEPGEDCVSAGAPIAESENETEQTYRPFASLATLVGDEQDEK